MADNRQEKKSGRAAAIATASVIAALVACWAVIESLEYDLQGNVLKYLAPGFVVFPFVLLMLPRWLLWPAWLIALWGLLLAIRFSGDMGREGHFLTAGFLGLTSFFATASGAFIACSPPKGIVIPQSRGSGKVTRA